MTEAGTLLEIDGLTKLYGATRAVDGLDLSIREGEFLTLLGASGSGKSTVLMAIAGFVEPSRGDIRLRGRSILAAPPHRRQIGVVFQNYALFPHLTVFENVAYALRNRRWKRAPIERRVVELLDLVKLAGLEERLPAQLSGGQQQRVALARALAAGPDILLLDEPLGALDKNLREHMLVEFRRIHRRLGTTMIYVTHDQGEALVMSDRIAILDRGRLQRLGRPRDIYDDPGLAHVARFLGDANILAGTVVAEGVVVVGSNAWRIKAPNLAGGAGTVSIALRPERIALGEVPADWNSGAGTIVEALFLGDRYKYELATDGGERILIQAPSRHDTPDYAPGDRVRFGWHPSDTRVLRDGTTDDEETAT